MNIKLNLVNETTKLNYNTLQKVNDFLKKSSFSKGYIKGSKNRLEALNQFFLTSNNKETTEQKEFINFITTQEIIGENKIIYLAKFMNLVLEKIWNFNYHDKNDKILLETLQEPIYDKNMKNKIDIKSSYCIYPNIFFPSHILQVIKILHRCVHIIQKDGFYTNVKKSTKTNFLGSECYNSDDIEIINNYFNNGVHGKFIFNALEAEALFFQYSFHYNITTFLQSKNISTIRTISPTHIWDNNKNYINKEDITIEFTKSDFDKNYPKYQEALQNNTIINDFDTLVINDLSSKENKTKIKHELKSYIKKTKEYEDIYAFQARCFSIYDSIRLNSEKWLNTIENKEEEQKKIYALVKNTTEICLISIGKKFTNDTYDIEINIIINPYYYEQTLFSVIIFYVMIKKLPEFPLFNNVTNENTKILINFPKYLSYYSPFFNEVETILKIKSLEIPFLNFYI